MRISLTLFGILLFSAGVMAQEKPCALEVAACDIQVQAKALRLAEVEKEIASLRAQLNETGNKLAAERGNSASLASKSAEKDQSIAEAGKTIRTVTAERDAALSKIAKANRRRLCRWFDIGCVR